MAPLSLVGELRTEDANRVEASALYVRWRPWQERDFVVQAGKIPPVVGAFARRAYGRDNLVIGLPLAYQYLTSLRPDALPAAMSDVLRMRGRGWQPVLPIGSVDPAPVRDRHPLGRRRRSLWRVHWSTGLAFNAGRITGSSGPGVRCAFRTAPVARPPHAVHGSARWPDYRDRPRLRR